MVPGIPWRSSGSRSGSSGGMRSANSPAARVSPATMPAEAARGKPSATAAWVTASISP